jgi:exonuclease SbcC
LNKQRTISLIRERFKTLTEPGAELVRAEQRHENASLAVFYFDFSQAPAKDGFSLTNYLQENLANDFYQHEGSLQWNYYLYFVLEKELLQHIRQNGKLAEIEGDRTFARKFFRDEAALEQELQTRFALAVYGSSPPKDLAAAWTEKLIQAGYGSICNPNAAYTEIVKGILHGKPSTATQSSPIVNNVQPGKHIERITIETFREHPTLRTFDFGAVNLIRGVNGTGKTSLLEAIELSICGGIRRQDNAAPHGASLMIKLRGENVPRKAPTSDMAVYRALDKAWYGGYYRNVNKLCENFGRFNFFDSDAGFRLSDAKSPGEIKKAIEDLFLGEYASTLENMMLRCHEQLEKEKRDSAKEIRMRRSEAASLEENLQSVRRIKDTRETLLDELKAKAVSNNWKKLPGRFNLDALVTTKETADDLSSQFTESARHIRWLPGLSLKSLNQELLKLNSSLTELQAKADVTGKTSETFEKTKDKKAATDALLQLLAQILAFHDEPGGFLLRGVADALEKQKEKLEQLKAAQAIIKELDATLFEESSSAIDAFEKEQDTELAKQKRLINQRRKAISDLESQIGEIKSLLEQIKGLGQHVCELKPDTKECPLCGAWHEQGLLVKIASRKAATIADTSLREMTTELSRAEKQLGALQRVKHNLRQIREAAALVFESDVSRTRSLKVLFQTFSTITEQIDKYRATIDDLIAKQKRLKLRGFTEEKLEEHLSEATDFYEFPISKLSNADTLRTLIGKERSRSELLAKELMSLEMAIKEGDAERARLVKKALASLDFEEPIVELHRRKSLTEEALEMVRHAETHVSVGATEEFSAIRSRLKVFSEAVARIHVALKEVEEKNELEKKWAASLESARKHIDQLETKRSRAEKAGKILQELLEGESKAAYLSQMINQQRQKLVAIFRRVHAPNEFVDVRLNGDLYVKRRTGTEDGLSRISTGQRSALALSIFLTMNSSVGQNAPWLIFDDPVAQVDDLNTLSFFDALRELVLEGNRQVFFATANTRVANLFARKFDFLDTLFKEISLSRSDS